MLWNWTTVDACFLSRTWHITSKGMFAGTCIGVISLVLCLEFLRRVGREYEAFIVQRARRRYQFLSCRASETSLAGPSAATTAAAGHASTTFNPKAPAAPATLCNDINNDTTATHPPPPFRPSLIEQLVRATLHMLQFAVAYFVMLLAMYFNGYIIICIFIGAFLGAFIFSWETIGEGPRAGNDATAVTKCCG
ncbi:high-affinity Cu transporter CTR3 [Aspergillus homomorphus CBS 101889]|uniref:Copper transport protein n=1 Tax=Aspergillus homomorphus (strain CBS 101889) TaxID=1450537 RepID=A0A395HTL1_ASPHC|nr:Ctr copper transporter [Aspergillus homomorphus CBS 101889]RAL11292.1 Ctr copper transporter [Aspergillus homomorphus CBS 101889]